MNVSKSKWIWKLSLGSGLLTLIVIYGWFVEPKWLEVTRTEFSRVGGSMPVVIAQISDLHLQKVGVYEQAISNQIRQAAPDILVLSGDVIDTKDSLDQLDKFLKATAVTYSVAVLGNWEYWSDVDLRHLRKVYEAHGVHLLVNESTRIEVRGRSFVIHGIDDYTAGKPRLPKTKAETGDLSILVQHSPAFFDEPLEELGKMTLCLSGHTHGGQVTAFGWAPWSPPGSGRYKSGLYQTATCPLYVSRGLGTSLLNFRLGARPELAFFSL